MRVEVDREVELLAQSRDQACGGGCAQQAGHVLDGQHVGTGADDLLGQLEVVVQCVQTFVRVGQVARVAQGDLGDRRSGLAHGLDRRAHLLDVVQRVEDPEDVDAGVRGFLHERLGDRLRVRRVADRVATAQQHLQVDVRHGLAQRREPLPRVLGEEAQRHVVRRAAPALQRQQLRRHARDVRCDGEQVLGAHSGGEQRLVRVAERGVRDADRLALPHPPREALGAELGQLLLGTGGRFGVEVDDRQLLARVHRGRAGAVRVVDRDVREVGQQTRAAVGGVARGQQVRALLDERRGDAALVEVRVVQNRLQERDVRGDTADAELRDRAARAGDGELEVAAAAGELHEHRVEVRTDRHARAGRAAVETDAGTTGRAVGADHAGVRAEAVGRILGRDAALQCGAAQLDGVLAEPEVLQRLAGRDAHLRLHEVDVGHFFRDRVLDLDARVHLDEDVVALRVEQELHGAGVAVADVARELHGVVADAVAQLGVEVRRGRDLDDLLVAPLHRAVALEEVDHVALAVGEDLHLDVTRLDHGLLEEHGRVAERRLRLARRRFERLTQRGRVVDLAHATAATTGDGLHEHGEAHRLRGLEQLVDIGRRRARLQHRQPGLTGGGDGARLVARQLQDLGDGADERETGLTAGHRELRILRQEAVSGVDRVGAGLAGGLDDLVDGEVGADGVSGLADLVRLVRLQPVQRVSVLVRENGDRSRAQFVGGTERANRDLAAVGDKNLAEHP